ncbi:MAG: cation:proton antiporter, partial [Prevotellaceae bacterium]|nr:cation:proton antiporter [Prevotellaceae bacterium]
PYIGRRFFRRYSDGVMQFIFVLAMVFLGAGIMQFVGMEGILGAFLTGLALNRLIPHVSPLMSHLEFVGNALFIPYFLIGVGMLIDVHVIFGRGDALKVAAVMIVVALVGKWIASWLTQKICKMSAMERKLMFGLSNAQAAATLAAVLVGYNIILPGGEHLLNDDVLNGTVLLILVTCIVSSLTTEHAARQMALSETALEKENPAETERFLIPLSNLYTIESLMNLALLVRDPKQTDNLMVLNVIKDSNASDALEIHGKRCLDKAARITDSAGVGLRQGIRYGTTVTTGIIHASKEFDATDVIIGLHHKVNVADTFFGSLTEELLGELHREVMVARFLIPVNTIKRIIIAVPPKAEFEAGVRKWVGHFCRMGCTLGCRVHFFACEKTITYLQVLTANHYSKTLTDFSLLEEWDDLLLMTGEVSYDNLFVVITARKGSISYDNSFEKLPGQLDKYFSNNSLIVLYPDQMGQPQEFMTFLNPRSVHDAQYYERVGRWFYRWFKSTPKNSSGRSADNPKEPS